MEIANEENEDKEMANHAMASSSTTPTCSSAQLVAKLKKLMETELTLVPMTIETKTSEMDIDDPKKRARAPTPLTGTTLPATNSTQI